MYACTSFDVDKRVGDPFNIFFFMFLFTCCLKVIFYRQTSSGYAMSSLFSNPFIFSTRKIRSSIQFSSCPVFFNSPDVLVRSLVTRFSLRVPRFIEKSSREILVTYSIDFLEHMTWKGFREVQEHLEEEEYPYITIHYFLPDFLRVSKANILSV